MKKYLFLVASLFVALVFVGCGSDESVTPPEPPTPEIIDVVEPTKLASNDGFKRVELSWEQDCSADIKKTTIYWNNRQNSQTVNFTPASNSGTQTESLELKLAEGEYEFELINIDSKGNKSDAVKVSARSYGDEYCSELATREISAIYYEDDTAFITWKEALEGEIRTEYSYTDSESEQQVTAEVETLNEQIKVLPNEIIEVKTVYKPERCLDELYSPVKEFAVPEPEPVVVPTVRDASALDGKERVEISWMHDPTAEVAKTIIEWGGGEESLTVPHAATGEQEPYEVREMIEVAEGEYTFVLKNVDAKGNESVSVAIEARSYGEEYCSQLPTREIISIVYEDDHAVVEWAEADAAAIRTEYTYTDLSGEEQFGIVTETSHNIPATPLSIIKVQSVYQPERCMDELWSPAKEYTVPEPEIVDVAEPFDLAAMDGLGRVQISWKQDTSADISRSVLSWGDEELPYNRELLPDSESGEYSVEVVLNEGEYTFRLQNFDSKGHESEIVTVDARSYGEQYCATLPTREMVAITTKGSGADAYYELSWGTPCEGELHTKYSYTSSQTGELTIKTASRTSSKSTLVRAVAGSKIKVQSVFKPENCLDELESAGVEYDTPAPPAGPELVDVKIMQFNVCVGNAFAAFDGYSWSRRCAQIAALIKEQEPDVICFQELSTAYGFYNNIMTAINSSYSNYVGDVYSGVYGERGGWSNEGIGLAYKTSRFDKVNGGMFWLNDHPDTAGTYSAGGLSSNYNRICVWARLREKSTKGEFVVASTHIDNANNDQHAATDYAVMRGQVQITINNVQAHSKGDDDELPIVIAGDMNANPDKSPIAKFSSNGYTDAYTVAQSVTTQSASIPRSTMVDAIDGELEQNYACYDYIFVKRHSKVMSYSINSPKFGGVSLSDHNSVTAVVQLECRVME